MKLKEYRKILAAVLSVGMLTIQTMPVLGAPIVPEEGVQTEQPDNGQAEVRQAMAVDGSGMVDISEDVLKMLEDETVYQDEETGYLYDRETKQKVDPVTGERVVEAAPDNKPDSKPDPKPDKNPDNKPDDGTTDTGKTETPGTDTSGSAGTGGNNGTADGSQGTDAKEPGQGSTDSSSPPGSNEAEQPSDIPETDEPKSEIGSEVKDNADVKEPSTNQALIAGQQIVKLPEVKQDFRFWTVARVYAFAKADLSVREEMNDKARAVGRLKKDGLLYVLQEEKDGWLYVESGTVRGFVKSQEVLCGDAAKDIFSSMKEKATLKAKKAKKTYTGIEGVASLAKELIPQDENEAFYYTHSTVNRTVIDKKYALTTVGFLNVREGKGTATRSIGTLKINSLCYIIADENEEWVYIESGDVRGFVNRRYLKTGKEVDKIVKETGEENFSAASEMIEPENNKACYYTLTSIKSGVPGGKVRESLLEFASQFIGNAYVWGGTSLTDGADCSGFVQSVYKQYGYDLPRVAEDQAQYGTKIAVEDAKPGDLIFYAKDGYIHHVVIYAGDGKTVEAMNSDKGIVRGKLDTSEAVWATRVLKDTTYGGYASSIGEVNATDDMYGDYLGNFQLTYYCSCEVCCDVETGITATGTPVLEGQTIAVDPSVIPYGTQVIIGGHVFIAEDCGGAVKDKHIDIYVNDHDRALSMGVDQAEVFMVK